MIGDPDDKLYGEPRTLGRTSASLHIFVDNNEAVLRRAVEAGAEHIQPPTEMFCGTNSAKILPFDDDSYRPKFYRRHCDEHLPMQVTNVGKGIRTRVCKMFCREIVERSQVRLQMGILLRDAFS